MIIAIRIFRINENVVLRMQIENSVIRDVAPPHAVSISLNVLPLDKSDIIGLHVNNVMCGACFAGPVDRACVARRFQVLILEQLRGYLCTDVKNGLCVGTLFNLIHQALAIPYPLRREAHCTGCMAPEIACRDIPTGPRQGAYTYVTEEPRSYLFSPRTVTSWPVSQWDQHCLQLGASLWIPYMCLRSSLNQPQTVMMTGVSGGSGE